MLSIDCEGCEWSAFEQMARDPRALKILSGVELLLLDAHFSPSMVPPTLAQVRVCMRRLSLQSICVSTLWECQELRAAHYGASLGYLCSHVTHAFGLRPPSAVLAQFVNAFELLFFRLKFKLRWLRSVNGYPIDQKVVQFLGTAGLPAGFCCYEMALVRDVRARRMVLTDGSRASRVKLGRARAKAMAAWNARNSTSRGQPDAASVEQRTRPQAAHEAARACALLKQGSEARCILGVTFGCETARANFPSMVWVRAGCRGVFSVPGAARVVSCGDWAGKRGKTLCPAMMASSAYEQMHGRKDPLALAAPPAPPARRTRRSAATHPDPE